MSNRKSYFKTYRNAHKEELRVKLKQWRRANPDKVRAQKVRVKNKLGKEKLSLINKVYKKSRKDKITVEQRLYSKTRRMKDPAFKIRCNLRSRISGLIKRGSKRSSITKALGCSLEELKQYLESKFQQGMTWENYGSRGWHVDHIKPLCSFDLTDPVQFQQAIHYTNLQPLWFYENLKKRDMDIKQRVSL